MQNYWVNGRRRFSSKWTVAAYVELFANTNAFNLWVTRELLDV